MRVLWLIKSLNIGGAERLLEVLAARRDPAQVEVEVAFVDSGRRALVGAIERQGVRVHDLGSNHDTDLRWSARLRRLVRTTGFDLVHTHSPLTAAVARMALRGVPHVYTEHNVWSIYHPATRALNALTYGRNAQVIAVSDAVADAIRQGLPGRSRVDVRVIYHGFDDVRTARGPEARAWARTELGLPEGVTAFGTVAVFRPQKRHTRMIDAFASVAGARDDVRLVLIGGGPLEDDLRTFARDRGVADRVIFTGIRHDTQDLLPGLDVFLLSSVAEGLPVSLLEAMAAGVAPVVTAVGGIPEVIEDGVSGLLIPPEDHERLVASMARALDPTVREAIAAAGPAAVADLSISSAWDQLLEVYRSALGAAVPTPGRATARASAQSP